MKTIVRGQFTCGYSATHVFGYENQPEIFRQILAYDDYDHDPEVFMTASKFSSPIKSIVLGKMAPPRPAMEFPNNSVKRQIGVGFHLLCEKVQLAGYQRIIRERRIKIPFNGVLISGKFDLLFKKQEHSRYIVSDFKTTKSGYTMYDSPEHTCQLSINRMLIEMDAIARNKKIDMADYGMIFEVFTDWNEKNYLERVAKKPDTTYPSSPFCTDFVNLMDRQTTAGFVTETINQVQHYLTRPQEEMPPCEDTWRDCLRCRQYCDGRDICKQFADWKIKNNWR